MLFRSDTKTAQEFPHSLGRVRPYDASIGRPELLLAHLSGAIQRRREVPLHGDEPTLPSSRTAGLLRSLMNLPRPYRGQSRRATMSAMAGAQLLRDDQGREVVKFTTPSGVTAWVATGISDQALRAFAKKLARKMRDTERRRARLVLAGEG